MIVDRGLCLPDTDVEVGALRTSDPEHAHVIVQPAKRWIAVVQVGISTYEFSEVAAATRVDRIIGPRTIELYPEVARHGSGEGEPDIAT